VSEAGAHIVRDWRRAILGLRSASLLLGTEEAYLATIKLLDFALLDKK
jgi:hypothetical protein